jgi:cathepsin D
MGMGFQAISSYRASPVFQTLVAQGGPASAVFAFKLASSGGELYIGGTNPALYSPPISWASVTKQVSLLPPPSLASVALNVMFFRDTGR